MMRKFFISWINGSMGLTRRKTQPLRCRISHRKHPRHFVEPRIGIKGFHFFDCEPIPNGQSNLLKTKKTLVGEGQDFLGIALAQHINRK